MVRLCRGCLLSAKHGGGGLRLLVLVKHGSGRRPLTQCTWEGGQQPLVWPLILEHRVGRHVGVMVKLAIIIAVIIVARVVHVAGVGGHQARVPVLAIEALVSLVSLVSVVITLTGHTHSPAHGQARVRGRGGGVTWRK